VTDNPSTYDGDDRRETHLLPWWVRAIAVIGIPGAIAVFLVYVGATEIPKIKTEIVATRVEVLNLQRLTNEHVEQNAAMYRMLQRICSNTAKNEDAKQRCFDK
jgi:hypothetical protein